MCQPLQTSAIRESEALPSPYRTHLPSSPLCCQTLLVCDHRATCHCLAPNDPFYESQFLTDIHVKLSSRMLVGLANAESVKENTLTPRTRANMNIIFIDTCQENRWVWYLKAPYSALTQSNLSWMYWIEQACGVTLGPYTLHTHNSLLGSFQWILNYLEVSCTVVVVSLWDLLAVHSASQPRHTSERSCRQV